MISRLSTTPIARIRPRSFLQEVSLTDAYNMAAPGKYLAASANGSLRLTKLVPDNVCPERPLFLCSNHGEAFGQLAFAYLQGKVGPRATLVHFDAHHDLMGLSKIKPFPQDAPAALETSYDDAGFIHPLLFHGLISRYLWVLPLGVDRANLEQYLKYFSGMVYDPFPITAELFPAAREGFPYPARRTGPLPTPHLPGQAVTLELVLASELAERISRLSGEELVLDIDLDYFGSSNSQFGDELAPEIARFFPADPVLAASRFACSMKRMGIRPAASVIALSPDYFSHPEKLSETAVVLTQGLLSV